MIFFGGVILSGAAFQAQRRISRPAHAFVHREIPHPAESRQVSG
jgi:hypothetical protein